MKIFTFVTMMATLERGRELCEIFTYVTMIATLERGRELCEKILT